MKNSIAEDPYFVMEFLDTLNTELRTRSVFDYKTMRKANKNDVINSFLKEYFFLIILVLYIINIYFRKLVYKPIVAYCNLKCTNNFFD